MVNIRAEEKQAKPQVSLGVLCSIPDLFPFPDFVLGTLKESVKEARGNGQTMYLVIRPKTL